MHPNTKKSIVCIVEYWHNIFNIYLQLKKITILQKTQVEINEKLWVGTPKKVADIFPYIKLDVIIS